MVVDEVDEDDSKEEDSTLLVEDTEKTMEMTKKDEVVLVDMKPMVSWQNLHMAQNLKCY